jgi:hypothetical protein
MRQLTLIIGAIIFFINSATGQSKTYFGLEFSIFNDIYKIEDQGNALKTVPLTDAQGGINIRQEIKRKIFLEAGVIFKQYWEGFGFRTIPSYSASTDDPSWLIPVRIGANLNIYKEQLYLVPVIGYTYGINPPYGGGGGRGRAQAGTLMISYNYTNAPDSYRYFPLLQTGIGFEFPVLKTFLVSISSSYYSGFKQVTRLDITYTVNGSDPIMATATSKGEFWCGTLGVKYPISNLWVKKEM